MSYGKIEGELVKETEKARLIKTDGKEVWIPVSCFKRILKTPNKSIIKIEAEVSEWILEKHDIYYE